MYEYWSALRRLHKIEGPPRFLNIAADSLSPRINWEFLLSPVQRDAGAIDENIGKDILLKMYIQIQFIIEIIYPTHFRISKGTEGNSGVLLSDWHQKNL